MPSFLAGTRAEVRILERPGPTITVDADGPLNSDFLDGLADALGVPETKRCSFKEEVQRAAREFQAARASPKVDVIRREIGSLAKAIVKVLTKPTQKKREALRWRLDNLSPEATDYLLRHHPPHDRDTLPWGSSDLDREEDLEDLYARCCVRARTKDKNGNPLQRLDIKYGPVKEPGPPLDHPKRALYAHLGLAFLEGTGTYPKRKDIVYMTDHVLNQLGEPVKQNRGGNDTDLARDYLRHLREPHRD